MNGRLSSLEARRVFVAFLVTGAIVALQIMNATRVSGDEGQPASSVPAGAIVTPMSLTTVSGLVVAIGDELVAVRQSDRQSPVSFPAASETVIIRDGLAVHLSELRPNDKVRMTIDAISGRFLQVQADPAPPGWTQRLNVLGPIAAVALLVSILLLVFRRLGSVPAERARQSGRGSIERLYPAVGPFSRPNRPCGA